MSQIDFGGGGLFTIGIMGIMYLSTDKILPIAKEWQNRPLERIYTPKIINEPFNAKLEHFCYSFSKKGNI